MPSYFIVGLLSLPFVGFYLLSQGAYAISVGKQGYDNGAMIPYAIFYFSFLFSFFLFKKKALNLKEYLNYYPVSKNFLKYLALFVFIINLFILILFLFVWGSISIFMSDVGRGEFRASISSGGVFYYWFMKIIAPGIFLYYTISYLRGKPSFSDRVFFKLNFILLLLIGMSTGFKTTFITLLLPIIFFYFWRAGFKDFIGFSFSVFFILIGVYLIVTDSTDISLIINLLSQRLFIAQADVSWYLWSLYISGESFPNYFQSLLSIFGSKVLLILTGVDRSNLNEWIYYDYNSLINVVAGLPVSVVEEGHNIVGTIFSESLIAFGLPGLIIFPLFAGVFIALILNKIQKSIVQGRFIIATLLMTYFSVFVLGWVQGGGLSTIIHISLFVGFFVLYVVINLIISLSKINWFKYV